MNMMRRVKSIASGRTSISSDLGGDSSTNRAKMDQESGHNEAELCSRTVERGTTGLKHHMASPSLEGIGYTTSQVLPQPDTDAEPTVVNGNGAEAGHIISTTVGGRNGQPKKTISYMAERVVGTGSFGVISPVKCLETG